MSNSINPIYWERTGDNPVQIVDLRTLPEDVKVAVIQAAIRVASEFNSGTCDALTQGSEADKAIANLTEVVENVSQFMHEIPSLVPRQGQQQ